MDKDFNLINKGGGDPFNIILLLIISIMIIMLIINNVIESIFGTSLFN